MRYWIAILALATAPLVSAERLDAVLASVEGTTGDEEDFIANVTWSEKPEKAYYACTERLGV